MFVHATLTRLDELLGRSAFDNDTDRATNLPKIVIREFRFTRTTLNYLAEEQQLLKSTFDIEKKRHDNHFEIKPCTRQTDRRIESTS